MTTALRTAVENGEGVLDKEATSHDDCFDTFCLQGNITFVSESTQLKLISARLEYAISLLEKLQQQNDCK